jgi:hypothetical protein
MQIARQLSLNECLDEARFDGVKNDRTDSNKLQELAAMTV